MQNWVLPFLHNAILRPVLIAILGHFGVLFGLAILGVVRGGAAEGAVQFLLVAMSALPVFEELRIERRPAAFAAVFAVSWAMGFGVAGIGWWTGAL